MLAPDMTGRVRPVGEVRRSEIPTPKRTFRDTHPRVKCQRRSHPRTWPRSQREKNRPEGLPGGILGGEDEKPEVEVPEALAGAEAFAAAVAAKLAGNDPGVARKTEEFLSDQSHLLKLQARHLQDEHALRVAHLRNQLREENVRRFSLRLRVGFQLFIALVAAIIGIAAAIMIRDA